MPSTVLHESGGLADTPAGWRSYRDYLSLLVEKDPRFRDAKFGALTRGWAIGSAAFRAELRTKLNDAKTRAEPFLLLGVDREAVRAARIEVWEDQLQKLAAAFRIPLHRLPRKKSAVEKLTLEV